MSDLSESKKQEFDLYYGSLKLPNCSKCGNNNHVIPAVCGKPSRDLYLYSELGSIKLGGCCEHHEAWCKKCEEYVN